jgi:hypothetical protein
MWQLYNYIKNEKVMKIFLDKNREKKRQEVIKRSLSSSKDAQRMLQNAGIITKQGNVSPVYRTRS